MECVNLFEEFKKLQQSAHLSNCFSVPVVSVDETVHVLHGSSHEGFIQLSSHGKVSVERWTQQHTHAAQSHELVNVIAESDKNHSYTFMIIFINRYTSWMDTNTNILVLFLNFYCAFCC